MSAEMKLSEAILLGSTILSPVAGEQIVPEKQAGCALGMAAVARGCSYGPRETPFDEKDRRSLGVEGVWGEWVNDTTNRPCNCWFRRPKLMRIRDIITHIFDVHIMGRKKDWTLDRLVKWVESVEPADQASPINNLLSFLSPNMACQQQGAMLHGLQNKTEAL